MPKRKLQAEENFSAMTGDILFILGTMESEPIALFRNLVLVSKHFRAELLKTIERWAPRFHGGIRNWPHRVMPFMKKGLVGHTNMEMLSMAMKIRIAQVHLPFNRGTRPHWPRVTHLLWNTKPLDLSDLADLTELRVLWLPFLPANSTEELQKLKHLPKLSMLYVSYRQPSILHCRQIVLRHIRDFFQTFFDIYHQI
jgi:hypothetical protein